jgi:hypothetical protein
MFTRMRPAALAIAAEWSVPGMARDDVRQEALLALWIATGKHDPARGAWPPFARLAVKARMRDLLQAATCDKRTADTLPLDDERDGDPVQLELLVEQRERLREGLATDWEPIKRERARERAKWHRRRARAAA